MRTALFTVFLSVLSLSLPAQVIYVDPTAAGTGDGTRWADAFTDLHTALSVAQPGDSIWIAEGTYYPTAGTDRHARFALPDSVALFGGFDGTETALSQRDWEAHPTVLDGDIGVPGDSVDNSYTILYIGTSDTTTVVDGLLFRHGTANGDDGGFSDPSRCGGALYIMGRDSYAYPRIRNCRFTGNYSEYYGGAVYVNGTSDGSVAPQFFNCTFSYNYSKRDGGAIRRDGGSWLEVENDFWDCTFEHNIAERNGGGVFYLDTERSDTFGFLDCTFRNNLAEFGGGVVIRNGRSAGLNISFEGCSFEGNEAVFRSSAIIYQNANFLFLNSFLVKNTTFVENKCSFGSIVNIDAFPFQTDGGGVRFEDCIFELNSALSPNNSVIFISYVANNSGIERFIRTKFIGNQGDWLISSASSSEIDGCQFIGNGQAQTSLIYTFNTLYSKKILNSIFWENKGKVFIRATNSTSSKVDTFANCTFYNTLLNAVDPSLKGNVHISNSIFLEETEGGTRFPISGGNVAIEHSLFSVPECDSLPSYITCGPGNLFNLDPLFLDTAAGDFRLHPCSPARNAGDNAILNQLGITTDIDGNPRIQEGTVDMGPYEMPAFDVLLSGTSDADCHGESSGTATLDVQSGCGPFTIEFGGASTFTDTLPYVLDGLSPGTLNITVTDSDDRTEEILVNIGEPPLLTATASATPVDCTEGMFGTATASIGGGTPGYTIRWSDSTAMATASLPAGPHALQVTDSLGCVAVDSFTIEAVGMLAVAADSTAISCHPANGDSANGSATATPDGLAPYNWQWQDGQSTETIGQLPPGTYTATVTDALGCTGTATISLTAPDSIALSIEAPGLVCQGSMDAVAAALASGGTLPYFFQWENGATDSLLTNLGHGQYALMLTDGNGCISQSGIQILENTSVQLDTTIQHATGAMNTDGAIFTSNPQGGQPPYLFLWETGDTTDFIENVPPGSYSLTVTDSLGCETVFTFVVDFEVAASEALEGISLTLWPVPVAAGGTCHLRVESQKSERLKWYLLDAPGRTLQSGVVDVVAGETLHRFPAPAVAGHYWLVLEASKGKGAVLELVVQ